MQIENQTEFLLSAALRKCGNLEDAQDLTQETLLSALVFINNGRHIDDIRGWLLTVMNRKFYAILRKKYQQPTVSIGEDFDISDQSEPLESIVESDEAERVRREVVFLASIYREVVVRYYMDGQSVADIASVLGIPEGTVKSRLSAGRSHMKKGIDEMKIYTEQSYEPISLHVANSGCQGINNEPWSLVYGDLIAQNILYLAYEKPITETGLAKAIGIPTAYIEPIVQKLVDGELMKRVGEKVYTDFIIFTNEDHEKHIPAQNEFVEKHFDLIWQPYEALYGKLRKSDYYLSLNENKRDALELFCFFNAFDYGSYMAFSNAFEAEQIFPDRPNGGRWIAFGHMHKKNEDRKNGQAHRYSYAGQRNTWLNDYLGAKCIRMSLFDPEGFPIRIYHRTDNGISDENLIKLLYIIESGIDFRDSGFDEKYLSSIPWLAECNILCYDNGKPKVNIPVFRNEEVHFLDSLLSEAQLALSENLKSPLKQYLVGKKKELPPHLKSVPLQKQYMISDFAILMSSLRFAMKKDLSMTAVTIIKCNRHTR